MGIALAGIVSVQLYWLKTAIEQNKRKFDQKVNDALQNTVKKLEEKAIEKVFIGKIGTDKIFSNNFKFVLTSGKEKTVIIDINDSNSINTDTFMPPQSKRSISTDKNVTIIGTNAMVAQTHVLNGDTSQKNFSYTFSTNDSILQISDIDRLNPDSIRSIHVIATNKINKVVKKMVLEYESNVWNIKKNIKPELLDSILRSELKQNDINIDFAYKISGSGYEIQSSEYNENSSFRKYRLKLFPDDLNPKPDELIVYFTDRRSHIFRSLSIILPLSLLFSLIILVAFSFTLFMLIKQKKISDIKTDFINNMTHEFKTPIATISLAADAVVNPKVIDNQEKIKSFIKVIKDENKRMNTHVERVLQMSLLDKSNLDLHLQKHNIHELINQAVENMGVQIQEKNGKIIRKLSAKNSFAKVDELHFINIINNLLDNALKYSNKKPEIIIETANEEENIRISVIDQGIGMSKDEQKKVFERFYRVSTGNIHNVKGFGLGLSYVKAIVEAFGGNIYISSEKGKGSRFDIVLKIV